MQSNYPVAREDAAQMCALQIQADCGPGLLNYPDTFEAALEKYIIRQVGVL